jgi:hypothetical protein
MKNQIKYIFILSIVFSSTIIIKNKNCKWGWISSKLCIMHDRPIEFRLYNS